MIIHHGISAQEQEVSKSENKGLYQKFIVYRVDGGGARGNKHHGCDYFVIDITHDKHAKAALLAYVDACEKDNPVLAKDIRDKYLMDSAPR